VYTQFVGKIRYVVLGIGVIFETMIKTLFTTLAIAATCALAADPAPFELKENDRVLFLGDGIVERDIGYNYLETMLSIRYHGKGITFRNAGWSGDTVWGESRAVFGQQKDGYNSLVKIVNETRPTVVFLFYGMNESFAGAAGLAKFEDGYNALLDNVLNPAKDAEHVAAAPAQSTNRRDPKDVAKPVPSKPRDVPRFVLVSPIAFQSDETTPLAKNGKQNENVKLYTGAIQKIAEKRGGRFVNAFASFGAGESIMKQGKLTIDGLHLSAEGYKFFASVIENSLGLKATVGKFPQGSDYDSIIPAAPSPDEAPLEKTRALIAEKNIQFFNKWRPQNETYLFLFRKHEQGRNAKEIPEFDPFITGKEAEIAKAAEEAAKALGL